MGREGWEETNREGRVGGTPASAEGGVGGGKAAKKARGRVREGVGGEGGE